MPILALTPHTLGLSALVDEIGPGEIVVEPRPSQGLVRLRERRWLLVLLDVEFGDGAALELLGQMTADGARVALMTRSVTVALTTDALERGACDVLAFPPDPAKVRQLVRKMSIGESQGDLIPATLSTATMIGQSAGMLAAFKAAARVAKSPATVLIHGESGTGKELLGRDIHRNSTRADQPFVPVNCAAIPDQLIESELFGHEKGAFTGATSRRIGRFERASGGTLFLDEVGDMSLAAQAKILRALQEGEVERLGGGEAIPVDIRVVAATNRNLLTEVAAGRFREDLYYRLAVAVIHLPPLRERGDDIRHLTSHFVAYFAQECRRPVRAIAASTMHILQRYSWPGNVRQLRNAIQRAVLIADGPVLLPSHLPPEISDSAGSAAGVGEPRSDSELVPLQEMEHRYIMRVLELNGGHLARTAEVLGIHRNTLRRKLRD
ncbi:MAG TPA: sigma-54 dependent transcriptional regulator [Longimicrobiales bacterium]